TYTLASQPGYFTTLNFARSNMNTYSVSRLALALAFGVTLSACSSTPADQQPSTQTAPGTTARPILNAEEAKNFTPAAYFQSLAPNAAAWT
ncbi:hypothetical protein LAN16_22265, partial [Mycobacterium tuberculosis]|nr:hypothetical protein [Mycobacterium tuberculosis]